MKALLQAVRKPACAIIWFLVHRYRKMLKHTVFISVTGSSGKTTTKDLIYHILSQSYCGTRTRGTYNGLSSHCRTILCTMPWHRFCVLEVAAGLPDSIARAVSLVPPDMGVVLNIGLEHFSLMRTREATAASKELVVTCLPETGTAFINTDDPLVEAMSSRIRARVVRFGRDERSNLMFSGEASCWPDRLCFRIHLDGRSYLVRTQLCGTHWVTSIVAALAVGHTMKVPVEDMLSAVGSFSPVRGRMCPVEMSDGVTYIEDYWKAAYWSINLSIDFMREAKASRRIIIIGTISDYPGAASPKYRQVAAAALAAAELVIFTGNNATMAVKRGAASENPRLIILPQLQEVKDYLQKHLQPGDLVLLKGSGLTNKMDQLVTAHAERLGQRCVR